MPAMIYRSTDLQFNTDRQKWQVYCSVFTENPNDPAVPDPVNSFQGILLDCANSSETAVKQACVAFCNAVEDATSSGMAALLGKLINAETGEVIPTP